jgi:DNA polymerase-3 subunit epsilon
VHVPAGITALTGIDNDMLADAPPFERIAKDLRERLEGRVFIAHNVRFDYGFIRREFALMGTAWRSPNLCTVRLSRALYPEMPRHNLDAVMERHDIHIANRHRASPTQALPRSGASCARRGQPGVARRARRRESTRHVAGRLPTDLPDDLPEGPGVYRFGEGEDGRDFFICREGEHPSGALNHCGLARPDTEARGRGSTRRGTETVGELVRGKRVARAPSRVHPSAARRRTVHLVLRRHRFRAAPRGARCQGAAFE